MDVGDPDGEQHPAAEHRQDQAVGERPQARARPDVAEPLDHVLHDLAVPPPPFLGEAEPRDHRGREDERGRVEEEREAVRVALEQVHEGKSAREVGHAGCQAAEQRRGDRDGPVRRRQDEAVGLGQGGLGDQLGDAGVSGREEEQGDRLVDEGDRVQQADVHERHHRDQSGPGQVAGDHDRPSVETVGHDAAHRGGEDRGNEPQDQHGGDGRLVPVGEQEGRRDEGQRGHPVAQRGDALSDEEPAEPRGADRRTESAAERTVLLGLAHGRSEWALRYVVRA